MNYSNKFALVGLDIFKTLNGKEYIDSKDWKERVADPIKFYLKENNVIVNIYLGHSRLNFKCAKHKIHSDM